MAALSASAGAATVGPTLADAPLYSTVVVPANVALTISVEWPTGDDAPYLNAYSTSTEYTGYWNPHYCYSYDNTNGYYTPVSAASSHTCTSLWSGNFLNWALTQTIDPLRQALTGGNRSIDTASNTVLQKAYSDGNVSSSGFPDKTLSTAALVAGATPFAWTSLSISNRNTGKQFYFSSSAPFNGGSSLASGFTNTTYPGDTAAAAATSANSAFTCQTVATTGSPSYKYCQVRNYTTVSTVTTSAVQTTQPYKQTCTTPKNNGDVAPNYLNNCAVWGAAATNGSATTTTLAYQLYGAVQVCTSVDRADLYDGATNSKSRCRAYGSNYKPIGLMQQYSAETTAQSDSIRYSVFGYLNDGNINRDGGVLRARMKSVGPYMANPGQTVKANTAANNSATKTAAEWSATDGTFISNPDNTDATTFGPTGSNSGVINYLNQFGFVANGYKSFDPVGELYYAATRYYRGLGGVASYSSSLTTAMYDGFPVITYSANNDGSNSNAKDDPITYTCSTNYIVGIGDIHTHADANLPGRTYTTTKEPTMPTEVSNDATASTGVNAVTAANAIAVMENGISATGGGGTSDYQLATGIGNAAIDSIASPTGGWCCNSHSFLMAGLSYDIHTRDIRQDITNKAAPITVSTFWLDVMENNDYHEKNQFWLTAKYGGFDTSQVDSSGNPLFKIVGKTSSTSASSDEYVRTKPLPTSWWNSGTLNTGSLKVDYVDSTGKVTANTTYAGYVDDHNNLLPDQYFQASNPNKMISSLNTAFAKIAATIPAGTSSALGLNSSSISTSGNMNYISLYANDWSGDVRAQSLALTTTGSVLSTDTTATTSIWDAKTWLPPSTASGALTYDTRIIATSSGVGSGKGVKFRTGTGGITTTQQATLVSPTFTTATAQQVLNYIRGDASKEGSTPTTSFRIRSSTVLGDITNSQPVVYGAPSLPYADTPLNPGYANFKTTYASRAAVLYVGSNDGMLHAFDATNGSTGGKELFAYVPSALFTTNTDANSKPVGLGSLTANPLTHHFMVDGIPVVRDVDFNRVGTTGAALAASAASDWHTMVVTGLGKGGGTAGSTVVGGGYVALDVTDPSKITDETALAGKVLWETDPASLTHMGYSYGLPHIVKTKKYGWTVILASGYGNDDGKGYFYLVNPKDGSLYETIATGVGSTTAPAGLAHLVASIPNASDFTADAIYAGDLLGNVWRVDLTTTGTLSATKFATLADSGGTAQPVTTYPLVSIDPTKGTRYVFVGTGKLLSDSDLVNPQTETFYAFIDGTNAAFDTSSTFPITRTNLKLNDPATGVTLGTSDRGFYVDLAAAATNGAGTQASAERINVQMVASGGLVLFAANLYGQNVCLKGSSRVFGLNYDSGLETIGKTLLQGTTSTLVSSIGYSSGVVTNMTIVNGPAASGSSSAKLTAMWGLDTSNGGSGATSTSTTGGSTVLTSAANLVRINWREIPESQ